MVKKSLVVGLASGLLAACASPTPATPPLTPTPAQTSQRPSPTPTPVGNWVEQENRLPGTPDWRLRNVADDTELAGFADHTSAAPGDKVTLRVTTTAASFTATAYRLGDYGGLGARQLWASGTIAGVRQPAPKIDQRNTVSCAHWTPTLSLDTTDWPPGLYLIKLAADNGKQKYVPLTVRSQSARGKVVLLAATSTYQAYNEYGGYSLYRGRQGFEDRARAVSFDRPYDRQGARLVIGYEQPVVQLAESLGLDLAYADSSDLDHRSALFDDATGIVSPGHDEYWSVPMRTAAERLRDHGTNLAFLGANAVYWRIRYAATPLGEQRLIEGYKAAEEDPQHNSSETTAMWRQNPQPKPENSLSGMLYECFPAKGELVVENPDFFLFAGTGAQRGSRYPGLIGVEIDRAYPIAGTPATLQVAAHSPVQCAQVGQTFSDFTYYTADSGAGVVAVGSMYWTKGLQRPAEKDTGITDPSIDFARAVTSTLFREMAAGPLGPRHPAQPNLAGLNASPTTRTGTGGPVATA